MIKAKDLRLGNLIYHINDVVNIYSIDNGGVTYYHINDLRISKETGREQTSDKFILNPIPLTEDWLMKFGFNVISENNDGTFNYWNKLNDCSVDVETHLLTNKIEKGYKYLLYERKRTKSIIYVHQLQNLYYSLTDKELTFI